MNSSSKPVRSFTTHQLGDAGVSPRRTRALVATGSLTRVSRGVYVSDVEHAELDRFRQARRHHLVQAIACARALPGSYLVGPTACIAHELPMLQVPQRVHLSRVPRLWSTRPEVEAHRSWPHGSPEISDVWGVAVQPAEAAVVETSATGGCLAGLVPADALLARGPKDLSQAVTAWGSRRGVAAARVVAECADGRRESPLETQVAWTAHGAGIQLIPQVVVRDRGGGWLARVDFVVEGLNIIVEVDGISKYRSHRDFRDERVRHNQIEEMGWIVVRVCLDDLRFERFIPRLRAALARASATPRSQAA